MWSASGTRKTSRPTSRSHRPANKAMAFRPPSRSRPEDEASRCPNGWKQGFSHRATKKWKHSRSLLPGDVRTPPQLHCFVPSRLCASSHSRFQVQWRNWRQAAKIDGSAPVKPSPNRETPRLSRSKDRRSRAGAISVFTRTTTDTANVSFEDDAVSGRLPSNQSSLHLWLRPGVVYGERFDVTQSTFR